MAVRYAAIGAMDGEPVVALGPYGTKDQAEEGREALAVRGYETDIVPFGKVEQLGVDLFQAGDAELISAVDEVEAVYAMAEMDGGE